MVFSVSVLQAFLVRLLCHTFAYQITAGRVRGGFPDRLASSLIFGGSFSV